MPNFNEQMEEHVSSVFLNDKHFAETVTWTPAGGSPVSILAIISEEATDPYFGDNEKTRNRTVKIHVATSDVASVKVHEDKATFHGVTWVAVRDENLQHGMRAITMHQQKVTKIQPDDRERERA